MRTREKQRIFKRFMAGESMAKICLFTAKGVIAKNGIKLHEFEQAIRDCINKKELK